MGNTSKPRDLTSEERERLADPVTYAAADASFDAARVRFAPQIEAIGVDIRRLLAGRRPGDLTGAESIAFMALKVEFDGMVTKQIEFAKADMHHRLNPPDG
jgi:hypothetical protein